MLGGIGGMKLLRVDILNVTTKSGNYMRDESVN